MQKDKLIAIARLLNEEYGDLLRRHQQLPHQQPTQLAPSPETETLEIFQKEKHPTHLSYQESVISTLPDADLDSNSETIPSTDKLETPSNQNIKPMNNSPQSDKTQQDKVSLVAPLLMECLNLMQTNYHQGKHHTLGWNSRNSTISLMENQSHNTIMQAQWLPAENRWQDQGSSLSDEQVNYLVGQLQTPLDSSLTNATPTNTKETER